MILDIDNIVNEVSEDIIFDYIKKNYTVKYNGNPVKPEEYESYMTIRIENNDAFVDSPACAVTLKLSTPHITNDYFRWGHVMSFSCDGCFNLKSLRGCPHKCSANFSCAYCHQLTEIDDCPIDCPIFDCSRSSIKKLVTPENVIELRCSGTRITNLKGVAQSCQIILATDCNHLTNVYDAPCNLNALIVNGCENLLSLAMEHSECQLIRANNTPITNFRGIPRSLISLCCEHCIRINNVEDLLDIIPNINNLNISGPDKKIIMQIRTAIDNIGSSNYTTFDYGISYCK